MNELVINRKSLVLDGLIIPPFIIAGGDMWFFDWPSNPGSTAHSMFLAGLSGKTTIEGLELAGTAAISCPNSETWLRRKITPQSDDPLMQSAISAHTGRSVRNAGDATMLCLPLVERSLLALEFACASSSLVLFDSAGLDPLGERRLVGCAAEKLRHGWGFLYFRFPILHGREAKTAPTNAVILSKHER